MRISNEPLGWDVFPQSVCAERMPPLKGEVPAEVRAVGFENADFGRSNVWRPIVVTSPRGSASWQRRQIIRRPNRRQQPGADPACKEEILCELPGWAPPRC